YSEGGRLARQLREPWWILYYDHWRLVALIHFLRDYRQAVDLGMQNFLEVRKPQYADFPVRIDIYHNLISAYMGIDPDGYADAVRQALDYLNAEITPESKGWYLVEGVRCEFALELDRLDEALEAGTRVLAQADADHDRNSGWHHSVFAFCDLCDVAYRR